MIDRRAFLRNCAVVTGAAAAGMDVMASEPAISDVARLIKGLVRDGIIPIEKLGYVSHKKATVNRTINEVFGESRPNIPYFRTLHSIIYREYMKIYPENRLAPSIVEEGGMSEQIKLDRGLFDFRDLLEFGASDQMPQADVKIVVFEGSFPSVSYAAAFRNIFSKSMTVFFNPQAPA